MPGPSPSEGSGLELRAPRPIGHECSGAQMHQGSQAEKG